MEEIQKLEEELKAEKRKRDNIEFMMTAKAKEVERVK